jgi:16S rRNA (cytosine1402-N4)-methyltransferase
MHIPVLEKEVIEQLQTKKGETVVDCTMGFGGHSKLLLNEIGSKGTLIGIEYDPENYERLVEKFKEKNVIIVNTSYANLKKLLKEIEVPSVDRILIDLGMSSWHIDSSGRGFTFLKDEELDMRYNVNEGISAKDILNKWDEKELEDIFNKYGEEQFSKKIAQNIVKRRKDKKIERVSDLLEILKVSIPKRHIHQNRHFATKVFQALRIAANDELSSLEKFLPQAIEALNKGGRLAVISFHSLEDRIVKQFFNNQCKHQFVELVVQKPLVPSEEEINRNPRSRSAKLRIIEKLK